VDLGEAIATIADKDQKIERQEVYMEWESKISQHMFNARHPKATIYNVFIHELSQLMPIKVPLKMWVETTSNTSCIDFQKTFSHKDHGIMSTTWMMGWEEVDQAQIPTVLRGSLPL